MEVIAWSVKVIPSPSQRRSPRPRSDTRHSVKTRATSRGGEGTQLQKMWCEIIPDMFGKSRRLMTRGGEAGMGGDGSCQMCHSCLYADFPFNPHVFFLLQKVVEV